MNDLIAYAYDFVSYMMLQQIKGLNIKRIILFGSAARGDSDKSSDVDIFIDTSGNVTEATIKRILKVSEDFSRSNRMEKWRRLGIKNEFSILIGNLKDKKWDELRGSMSSHAIVLWQNFSRESGVGKRFALISWSVTAREPNKRVNLARKMYGYKKSGKVYKGLLEEIGAKQVSNAVVLVRVRDANKLRKIFRDLGVRYTLKEVLLG